MNEHYDNDLFGLAITCETHDIVSAETEKINHNDLSTQLPNIMYFATIHVHGVSLEDLNITRV
jgi:hypothetical protein